MTHSKIVENALFGLDCIRKGNQMTILPIFSYSNSEMIENFVLDCLEQASTDFPTVEDAKVAITTSLPL